MKKILITTVPFAKTNNLPIELLESAGIDYCINPLNKKLTSDELMEMINEYDGVIAGTEEINREVLDNAPNLKIISRVGVGLDSVDLNTAKEKERNLNLAQIKLISEKNSLGTQAKEAEKENKIFKKDSQNLDESDKRIINQMINKLTVKEIVNLINQRKKISKREIYDYCIKLKNEN